MVNEDLGIYLDDAKEHMEKTIAHLEVEMSKVRAGKANPSMVDGIKVDYYGVETPLNQVATIKNTDGKTLVVQPWEKEMLEPIEKALLSANLGITPQNDGSMIYLMMPPLTEDRRKDLVKQIHGIAEENRVSIRNSRRETNDIIKSLQKEGLSEDGAKAAEKEIQELTDEFIGKIDKHMEAKEQEIMTV
jgi:ribosome recycling factor